MGTHREHVIYHCPNLSEVSDFHGQSTVVVAESHTPSLLSNRYSEKECYINIVHSPVSVCFLLA